MNKFLFSKFDIKKLQPADENAKNVFSVVPPYYSFGQNDSGAARNKVVVIGTNYRKFPPGVNRDEFVKIYNRCLDFIRRECAGCQLYFKPHPTSTDDIKSYGLDSFEIIKDGGTAEIFLYKNLNQLKYVFSLGSTVSLIAYSLGLNSYAFSRLFDSAFNKDIASFYKSYLAEMPESFFISDLNRPLEENKIRPQKDDVLQERLANALNLHQGTVWFTVVDPGFWLILIAFSKLIKNISPGRKTGLLIMRHERWSLIPPETLKEHFDELVFFPKVVYTLRPANLLNALKTVIAVKKFRIKKGDILCGIDPVNFLANCFSSYFKNNLNVAVTTRQIFDFTYHFEPPLVLSDFEIRRTAFFFNKIIEPLLGLHRAVRLRRPSGKNGGHFTRYQDALDKIFDAVYVLKYT